MKDIETQDTRVGTAFTFTGRGAWHDRVRQRLAFIAAGLAATCLLAIGVGYFMGLLPRSPALPPTPRDAMNVPAPDLSAGPQANPRWSLPPLPPVFPLPRARQSGNENGSQDRSAGTQRGPASRGRGSPAAAQPGGAPLATGSASAHGAAVSRGAGAYSRFHVQVGSFADRDLAISLLMRLRNRGYAATLIDGALYRVWVGGYLDRATAERLASSLRAEGFEPALTPR